MTVYVRYMRHGTTDVEEGLTSVAAAQRWIAAQEDAGEIFALEIGNEVGPLHVRRVPPPEEMGWASARDGIPDLPADLQQRLARFTEIVTYLESDLFEKVESPEPSATCWRSPLGWTVLLTERQDGTGYAGEVRSPDGSRVTTTSWIDVPWLDEHLP